jgi:hypothetical protein
MSKELSRPILRWKRSRETELLHTAVCSSPWWWGWWQQVERWLARKHIEEESLPQYGTDSNPGPSGYYPGVNYYTATTEFWGRRYSLYAPPYRLHLKWCKVPLTKQQCVRGCIQKFPDWPPGARTANGTALCQEVQLYRYLWISLVSFAAITLSVASKRVFIVACFVMTQSGNFWIQPRI